MAAVLDVFAWPEEATMRLLSDLQLLRLARIGKAIELIERPLKCTCSLHAVGPRKFVSVSLHLNPTPDERRALDLLGLLRSFERTAVTFVFRHPQSFELIGKDEHACDVLSGQTIELCHKALTEEEDVRMEVSTSVGIKAIMVISTTSGGKVL